MRRIPLAAALALGLALCAASPASAARAPDPPPPPAAAGAPLLPGAAASPRPASGDDLSGAPAAARGAGAPTAPGGTLPALPSPGDLFDGLDPRAWAEALLHALVELVSASVVEAARDVVDWALGLGSSSLNFVTRTPAAATYESTTVRSTWELSRGIALAGLAVVVMWGGFNVMLRRHLGSPYHGVMELVPRVVLAALALHLTLEFARLLIELNNALTAAVGQSGLPGYERATAVQGGVAHLVVAVGYAVVAVLLVLQMLLRIALIDLLIVLGPVMVLCWVLPQTQGWARWWAQLLPLAVFQQAVQMVVLRLGSSLMVELTPGRPGDALLTLLLGGAVLYLTLRVPSLLQGQLQQAGLGRALSAFSLGRAAAAGGR